MTAAGPAVRLTGATRRFGDRTAVDAVDLTIHQGERVALLGPSGAGKSTLLALLNASLRPTSGTVEVLGADLATLTGPALRVVQRRVGTIGQRLDLVDQVRVLHNVNAGRLGRWSTGRSLLALALPRPDPVVVSALEAVGLGWAVHERTERLSGGERQRVAIARLLVQDPELVLADEPVSSLDPSRASEVLGLLRAATPDGTLVVSLHQPELARRHCTRAIGLQQGRVVLDRPADELDDALLAELYALT
ncbi:phosphonate ABC transporter ATP-binding protein [uncultured Phycicoccus sp.]|uniref:phosphonate ABC transporter ATP-binding protein n=1 Tax=uncultured Phycicoccus sp. TaxID=661422 RepID=UPI00261EEE96|nr:ATP-binding cassette domain-containing protein [uncultured Phycicoccus sp.]